MTGISTVETGVQTEKVGLPGLGEESYLGSASDIQIFIDKFLNLNKGVSI